MAGVIQTSTQGYVPSVLPICVQVKTTIIQTYICTIYDLCYNCMRKRSKSEKMYIFLSSLWCRYAFKCVYTMNFYEPLDILFTESGDKCNILQLLKAAAKLNELSVILVQYRRNSTYHHWTQ